MRQDLPYIKKKSTFFQRNLICVVGSLTFPRGFRCCRGVFRQFDVTTTAVTYGRSRLSTGLAAPRPPPNGFRENTKTNLEFGGAGGRVYYTSLLHPALHLSHESPALFVQKCFFLRGRGRDGPVHPSAPNIALSRPTLWDCGCSE